MTKRDSKTVTKIHNLIVSKVAKRPRTVREIVEAAGMDYNDKSVKRDAALALRAALDAGKIIKPGAQRGRTVTYQKAA